MAIKIFFCYAHEDEALLRKLKTHLKSLERLYEVETWHDQDITAGKVWSQEIDIHLEAAHIILLLISPDFIASDYCYGIEMRQALERHEHGEARVIPIILRHTRWQETPLGAIQALPKEGKPVTDSSWQSIDEAFSNVIEGIQKVLLELKTTASFSTILAQNEEETFNTALANYEENIRQNLDEQIEPPCFVILLGTTAALVGLELMKHMLTLSDSDRRFVGFLFIDTDSPPDALIAFWQEHDGLYQNYPLRIAVPVGIASAESLPQGEEEDQDLGESISGNELPKEHHTFIGNYVPQYSDRGTGGIRNHGHVAACFYHQMIQDVLDRMFTSTLLARNFAEAGRRVTKEMQVNIVAFLGGGTGSGILLDIATMVDVFWERHGIPRRINLFGILPEALRGLDSVGLQWHKANSIACLLELIAFNEVATKKQKIQYKKYMRKTSIVIDKPVADGIYLFGYTKMDNPEGVARILGLDLFQRLTNASGVGSLELKSWRNRNLLGKTDHRGLLRMFSTTCPLEVFFPLEETAKAFACISTGQSLLTFTEDASIITELGGEKQQEWQRKWRHKVNFNNEGDANGIYIQLPLFQQNDFVSVSQTQLNTLWLRCEQISQEVNNELKRILKFIQAQEMKRISEGVKEGGINVYIQNLKNLHQEWMFVISYLRQRKEAKIFSRPISLEDQVIQRQSKAKVLSLFLRDNHNYMEDICNAYNQHLLQSVESHYYRLLQLMLQELVEKINDELSLVTAFVDSVKDLARKQIEKSFSGAIWHGRLEHPSPYQRHIFDLPTLHSNGRNRAVGQLYHWLIRTNSDFQNIVSSSLFVNFYSTFLAPSDPNIYSWEYKERNAQKFVGLVIEDHIDYYRDKLLKLNLLELLDIAAYIPQNKQSRTRQITNHLLEHLFNITQWISTLESDSLLQEGSKLQGATTSLYMGVHWRNSQHKMMYDQALQMLTSRMAYERSFIMEQVIDPHRLQISWGQHGISPGMIKDFSTVFPQSPMKAYLDLQKEWEFSTDEKPQNPLHVSSEAEHLVWDSTALGHDRSLPYSILLKTENTSSPE